MAVIKFSYPLWRVLILLVSCLYISLSSRGAPGLMSCIVVVSVEIVSPKLEGVCVASAALMQQVGETYASSVTEGSWLTMTQTPPGGCQNCTADCGKRRLAPLC